MSDWHRLSITELHAAYGRGDVTPVAVTEHYLSRIKTHNPALAAFIEVDETGARQAAIKSEERFRSDTHRPLEGVPIAIKANIAVTGMELNAGMKARQGIVADDDAYAVERLRSAGAIILGTLNMHEAALGATTDNPFFGRAINPHGEGLTPGGSSGGSGVAVAAGLCLAALGTDTLGSVRIPAAYCGIYALKPTPGTISTHGLVSLSEQYDAIGPMARTIDDLSMLTNVLFTPDLATAMRRSRFLELAELGGVECERGVLEAFQSIVGELPDRQGFVTLGSSCSRIREAAFVAAVRDFLPALVALGEERCADLSVELERLVEFGLSRSDDDLAEDQTVLAAAAQTLRTEIGSNGILIVPTAPQVAFAQGTRPPNNQADFTALANIAGLCAICIPIGRTAEGLPVGVQLIGPAGGEAMLVAQARMINDRVRGYAAPSRFW
jgi:aspartyl-tRNA(Asn)/glutamyl-tRNA(Gln) amidotransferase subunit A